MYQRPVGGGQRSTAPSIAMDIRRPDPAFAMWTDSLDDGVPVAWFQGPVPWPLHRCRPWTTVIDDDHRLDRCRCGAYRWGNEPWMFRNCRRWMRHERPGAARSPMRVYELPNGAPISLEDVAGMNPQDRDDLRETHVMQGRYS